MRHAASRRLHAYWDALRCGRPAPGRDEIDPAAIRDVLASTFMLDVAAVPLPRPADALFSLSGTRIDALFGRPLRGTAFDRLWAPSSSAIAAAALDAALAGCRPAAAAARGGPPGGGAVALELLLLPLAPEGGRRGRVLGALSAASTPAWVGLSATLPLDLVGLDLVGCDLVAPLEPQRDAWIRGAGRRFKLHPGGRDEAAHPAAPR